MNKEQTEAAIKVMQAYVDGEEIEYRNADGDWVTPKEPSWNFQHLTFRIKPKPVEFKVWYRNGEVYQERSMEAKCAEVYGYRLITVREVV